MAFVGPELRRVALRGLQSRQCDRADFPGAITAACSLDEALARAGEALALHVEGMAEDGEPIPPPSGFAEVIKDNPDAMTVLVPFPLARTLQRG